MQYPSVEEAKRLVAGVWGQQLAQIAVNCIAPLFWVENIGSSTQEVHNGTIFFLDTGTHRFAVSAYHVYAGYLEAIERDSNTICQILGEKFRPSDCVLDYSEQSDLITFEIDENVVSRMGKLFLMGCQPEWPPRPPEVERGMFFAGFPGIEKRFDDTLTINWGIFRGLCVANSVSVEQISVHFDKEYAVDHPDQIQQGYNSAGISGAPLITLVTGEGGINYWRLGGVIYEASFNLDLMLARPANFILPNGKIKKSHDL